MREHHHESREHHHESRERHLSTGEVHSEHHPDSPTIYQRSAALCSKLKQRSRSSHDGKKRAGARPMRNTPSASVHRIWSTASTATQCLVSDSSWRGRSESLGSKRKRTAAALRRPIRIPSSKSRSSISRNLCHRRRHTVRVVVVLKGKASWNGVREAKIVQIWSQKRAHIFSGQI